MFTMLMMGLAGAALLGGGLYVVNKTAGGNVFSAIRAQLGKGGRAAIEADPSAVLFQEIDDAAENVREAQVALAESKALVLAKEREVDQGQKELKTLEQRIQFAIDQGDPNGTAERLALDYARVEEELGRDKDALADYTQGYENSLAMVERAEEDLRVTRERAQQMHIDLKMSEKEKKLVETTAKLQPRLNTSKLGQLQEKMQQRIDENRAAGAVHRDLTRAQAADRADADLARKAAAASVLDKFRKPAPKPAQVRVVGHRVHNDDTPRLLDPPDPSAMAPFIAPAFMPEPEPARHHHDPGPSHSSHDHGSSYDSGSSDSSSYSDGGGGGSFGD